MYRVFVVIVFVVAFALVPYASLAGPGGSLTVELSPKSSPRYEVAAEHWLENVPAGKLVLSNLSDSDIPDAYLVAQSHPDLVRMFGIVDAIKVASDGIMISFQPVTGPTVTLNFGAIAAGSKKEFELLVDLHFSQVGDVVQLEINKAPDADFATVGSFPLLGTAIEVVAPPVPVPVPTPASDVWLKTPVLHTRRSDKHDLSPDTTVVKFGLGNGVTEAVISVEMTISSDPMMAALRADLHPTLGQSSWSIFQNFDKSGLKIAVAGVQPLVPGEPFLRVSFLTTTIVTGMVSEARFQLIVRLNEGPERFLEDVIRFTPLTGDASLDGEVTAMDGAIVLRYLVGLSPSEYAGFRDVVDVSGNGVISAYDAALIFRHVASILPIFPRDQKEYGVAEEMPGTTTMPASGKPVTSEPARVWLGEMASDGSGYTVPVVVDRMDGVLAGQLEIGPVPDGATVEPTALLEGYQVATNQRDGKLLVSFAGASSPERGGEMLRLKFATRPPRLTGKFQINENPAQILSTAVQQTSWGRIKAGFAR